MRQRLPLHLERFGGVARLRRRVGDDEGDRVADVAHFILGQHRMRRRPDVDAFDPALHRQRAEARRVRAGQNETHTRHRPGLRGIETETGMGVRRPHHHAMQRAARLMIGNVAPAAPQQRIVLHAPHRLTDTEFHSPAPIFRVP